MVIELVHAAVARKMLCHPVNNLIAATELICSIGVMARQLGMSFEDVNRIAGMSDTKEMQKEIIAVISKQDLTGFEESYQNLAEMILEYRGEAVPFSEEYQRLFWYSYREPLKFPKMNR